MPTYEIVALSVAAGMLLGLLGLAAFRPQDPDAKLREHLELFTEAAQQISEYTDRLVKTEDTDVDSMLARANLADLTAIAECIRQGREGLSYLELLYTRRIMAVSQSVGLTEAIRRIQPATTPGKDKDTSATTTTK